MTALLKICHACLRGTGIKCNGPCPCPFDPAGADIRSHATAGNCPIGRFSGPALITAPVRRQKASDVPPATWGPPLWSELHRWSLSAPDALTGPAWLSAFAARLPCGSCRSSWLAWVAAHPVPWDGDVFAWGWAAHEAVNAMLGKPGMTLGEAMAPWQRETQPELVAIAESTISAYNSDRS